MFRIHLVDVYTNHGPTEIVHLCAVLSKLAWPYDVRKDEKKVD